MNYRIRSLICIAAAGVPVVARASSYTSTVLFPLTLPTGFTDAYPANGPGVAAGGQIAGSATSITDNMDRAFAWAPSTGSPINLGLGAGMTKSYAQGTDGTQQVGYQEGTGGAVSDQALLWKGSATSVVNLSPTNLLGITASEAFGVGAGQQVGYGSGTGILSHALLWTGTSQSVVDLNPTSFGYTSSLAISTDGQNQVGNAKLSTDPGNSHAMVWSGTAASAIDLNPSSAGYNESEARGVFGNQQVGLGSGNVTNLLRHAMLWSGSAASFVDLNPTDLSGYIFSEADSTNGSQQVGSGFGSLTGNQNHALLWSGTAASAVDLQGLLPASGTWNNSHASTIDSSGNVFGVAMGSYGGVTGYFAVEWTPGSSGALDLSTGHSDLGNTSLQSVIAQVKQGYSNGTWNGSSGITSSVAAQDSTHRTALGVIQNNQGGTALFTSSHPFEGSVPGTTDVLIKYTYYGDTNLDGKVDGSDYTRIDAAFLADKSGGNSITGWFNGDFNYDGVIDGSDYSLIDNCFNQQGATIADQTAAITAQIANSLAPVPEPSGFILLGVSILSLRRRRQILA